MPRTNASVPILWIVAVSLVSATWRGPSLRAEPVQTLTAMLSQLQIPLSEPLRAEIEGSQRAPSKRTHRYSLSDWGLTAAGLADLRSKHIAEPSAQLAASHSAPAASRTLATSVMRPPKCAAGYRAAIATPAAAPSAPSAYR